MSNEMSNFVELTAWQVRGADGTVLQGLTCADKSGCGGRICSDGAESVNNLLEVSGLLKYPRSCCAMPSAQQGAQRQDQDRAGCHVYLHSTNCSVFADYASVFLRNNRQSWGGCKVLEVQVFAGGSPGRPAPDLFYINHVELDMYCNGYASRRRKDARRLQSLPRTWQTYTQAT